MEYFYISQDKRYIKAPYIEDFYSSYSPNLFCPEHSDRLRDKNVVYTKPSDPSEYIDFLSGPILLISEQLKRVLEAYDDITYKMFFILDLSSDQGEIYHAPLLPKVDCLRAEKVANNTRLILNKIKVSGRSIVKPAKDQWRGGLVIDMMVAESLLRRRLKGIHYQRLEVE